MVLAFETGRIIRFRAESNACISTSRPVSIVDVSMDDGFRGRDEGFFEERHLDEAEERAAEFCRLPGDQLPYPAEQATGDVGPCFACTYGASISAEGSGVQKGVRYTQGVATSPLHLARCSLLLV